MSQRRKIRREWVERDATGNITTLSDDVAVYVMQVGAEFKAGGTITAVSASFEVYHPGRVDTGSQMIVVSSDGTIGNTIVQCLGRALNASGVWVLTLARSIGVDVPVAPGDRLVHLPTGNNRFASLYTSDTADTLFPAVRFTSGNSVDPPDGALIADSNGVTEFYTDETDVDLVVVQASNVNNRYGVIHDVFTGRVEETIAPSDWGDEVNKAGDSWPALQSAIEYAEDERDRPVVIHVPAGTYKISGPLVVSNDNIELWLDKGARIEAHSSWSATSRGMIELTGDNCRIRGGIITPATGAYGVLISDSAGAVVEGVTVEGGNRGVYVETSTQCHVRNCEFANTAGPAVWLRSTTYSSVKDSTIVECGGASQGAIHIDTDGAAGAFANTICGNTFSADPATTATGYAIWLVALSSSRALLHSNHVCDNIVIKYGRGIRLQYTSGSLVSGNTIYDVGGVNSGSADNNHALRLDSCIQPIIRGNTVTSANGYGILAFDSDASGDVEQGVIADNVVTLCAEEGMYLDQCTNLLVHGNQVISNAARAGATYDLQVNLNFTDGILIGNVVGTSGLYIQAGATLEIGHNLEL